MTKGYKNKKKRASTRKAKERENTQNISVGQDLHEKESRRDEEEER